MTLRSAAAALIILAGTTVWAQSAEPSVAPAAAPTPVPMQRQGFAPRRVSAMAPGPKTTKLQTISPQKRVQDLEDTVTNMRTLLKQMRAKAGAKDSLAKANLDMWELMIGQLDKQLRDLRLATTAHEDMEARRAAMYKQADARATAAAEAARIANANKMAAAEAAGTQASTPAQQSPVPGTAAPVPAPAAAAPSSGSSASPN